MFRIMMAFVVPVMITAGGTYPKTIFQKGNPAKFCQNLCAPLADTAPSDAYVRCMSGCLWRVSEYDGVGHTPKL